jgi:hypothetical protein
VQEEAENVHTQIKYHVIEHRLNELETNLANVDASGFNKTV